MRIKFNKYMQDLILLLPIIILLFGALLAPDRLHPVYDDMDDLQYWGAITSVSPLGTDGDAFSVWSRLQIATRTTISLFFYPMIIFTLVGMFSGIVLAYSHGIFNRVANGLFTILNSIPLLLTLLLIIVIIEGMFYQQDTYQKLSALFMIFSFVASTKLTIELRGKIELIKNSDFIEAAEALGLNKLIIIGKHILFYNALDVIIYSVLNFLAQLLFVEITLTYLDLGASGRVLTLGAMFKSYFTYINPFTTLEQWQIIIPSLVVMYVIAIITYYGKRVARIVE